MSTSAIGRVVRPVTLLVAAMMLGQVTISITTAPTSAATVQTRVASCSGLDFHPIDDRTQYSWDGAAIIRRWPPGPTGDGWFVCDPHLPHKAVVTKVRFTIRDSAPRRTVRHCALMRASLSAVGGASQVLGSIAETGMNQTPGRIRRSDTSISKAAVDNAEYGYWFQCQIALDGSLPDFNDQDAAIIGAIVTYRISSTNG